MSTRIGISLPEKKNCDNGNVNASYLANAGGNWNNGSNTGAFHLNVNNSTSNSNANIGSHLMILFI